MSPIHVTTWLRAFFAMQANAMRGRGSVELNTEDEVARWPRTCGDDIVAIIAMLDPIVTAQAAHATKLDDHWHALLADLHDALADGAQVYRANRQFWNALAPVCIDLYALEAPLPSEATLALVLELLAKPHHRNRDPGDGPFTHFADAKTFDALYRAQFVYLRDLRGVDELEPEPGAHDRTRPIPRLTNGDAIALADYWEKVFRAPATFGPAEVTLAPKRADADVLWTRAHAEVDGVRGADPKAPYANRNHLWRAVDAVATYLAVAETAPSQADLELGALKVGIADLPENIGRGVSAVAEAIGHVASEIASGAGKGFFAGFRGPLLVGAGLAGLYFLTRSRRAEGES